MGGIYLGPCRQEKGETEKDPNFHHGYGSSCACLTGEGDSKQFSASDGRGLFRESEFNASVQPDGDRCKHTTRWEPDEKQTEKGLLQWEQYCERKIDKFGASTSQTYWKKQVQGQLLNRGCDLKFLRQSLGWRFCH